MNKELSFGGMTLTQRVFKRTFDIVFAALGLIISGWLILILWVIATVDTGKNGFFRQKRVGKDGKLFNIVKLRTMKDIPGIDTTNTRGDDPRITPFGRFLRKFKLDELPQLFNVLIGRMSFVGPRPDVPGYADRLKGDDRIILSVRPGITGPATLFFRDEEKLLSEQSDPDRYNNEVIYPQKVQLNRKYIKQYRFSKDIEYIWNTLFAKTPLRENDE